MAINTELEIDEKIEVKYPKKYKVFLLNDDYTSMEFVIDILMSIFHKNYEQAQNIMLDVHKNNRGLCGVYSYEIAETKVSQVIQKAKDNDFPLKATMEEE